tara:strand:- start:1276 stop:2244 length:969 start_codon:yes stop_codon:yes gene_type:complete
VIYTIKNSKFIILGFLIGVIIWNYLISIHRDYPSAGAIFSQSMIDIKKESVKAFLDHEKIIFSGGSNIAYGIDCKILFESLGRPVINFGCMVGLGPEIIFENIKPFTRQNDIIIFCWEYETYLFNRTNRNLNYLGMIEGPQSRIKKNFSLYDRTLLRLYFPVNLTRFSVYSLINKNFNPNKIYACGWQFDSLGNVTSNSGNQIPERELLATPLRPLLNKLTIHNDLYKIMRNINSFAKKNNLKLYATWPNTFEHPEYYSNHIVLKNFKTIKTFWRNLKIPLVGEPYDSMYTSEFFYDSCYHLNTKGVQLRTNKLSESFSEHL